MKKSVEVFLSLIFIQTFDLGGANCPDVVSRSQWGARKPEQVDYHNFPDHYVIISHTTTNSCRTQSECARTLSSIQEYHMDKLHYGDIGYNYLIGGDGRIYVGRGWGQTGAHTFGYNSRSVGIAFIGNFEDTPATEQAMVALQQLLDCGVQQGFLNEDFKLLAQRQVQSTLSPGLALYQQLQAITAWSDIV